MYLHSVSNGSALIRHHRSFLAGALPLSMALSPSQLRLISAIGMGVLVGTSLVVIIPEGIESVYTAGYTGSGHGKRDLQWHGMNQERGFGHHVRLIINAPKMEGRAQSGQSTDVFSGIPGPVIPDELQGETFHALDTATTTTPSSGTPTDTSYGDSNVHSSPTEIDAGEYHSDPPTFWIGFALITGFILMFLIDKLPSLAAENLRQAPNTRHISLDNLSRGLHTASDLSIEDEDESFLQTFAPTPKQSRSLATTTGLVIHAAADGIAIGASATSSNTKLGFIIFLVIMIHKAPAAFGLTSVLLKQGLSKRAARGHLIIFSLAAPFGALTTWLLVNILGGGAYTDGETGQWWTGMLLLFSAGTFL